MKMQKNGLSGKRIWFWDESAGIGIYWQVFPGLLPILTAGRRPMFLNPGLEVH
jgi:hypothetical protein